MRKAFFILGAMLATLQAYAQQPIRTYSDTKTDKWTMRRFENDPMNVRIYTFKNGLQLITSSNRKQPRIYTMVAVKTGSKNDPATNTGLAHYLEHMLFKGTDKYGSLDWSKEKPLLDQVDNLYEQYNSTKDEARRKDIYHRIDSVSQLAAKFAIANEYDKMCQAMGASGTNAFTNVEQTVYINDIPSNMLHKWMELESERYRNPVLRLFHTELEAVYEEKNIGLDRDGTKVYEKLLAELFKNHNYGQQTTIGTVEHLKNPSLKAIREYYHANYVPNNMAIIMAGDFDPDLAADGVAEHFGYMQAKPVEAYTFVDEMPRAVSRSFEIFGPDAANLTIGFRLPGGKSMPAKAARLIDLLLNNSSAGLIDLNLVKQQKVLSANSGVWTMNDYSVFMLTGRPREGQTLEELRDLLLGQLQLIREGKFDAEMLKSIILNEEISNLNKYKDNESRASFLMDAFTGNKSYQEAFNELYELSQMTKVEIMEVAKEFLDRDRIEIYKRVGVDSSIQKIVKPEIHPVELNRDKQSEFVTEWLAEETQPITPVFVDFSKRMTISAIGPAEVRYVKNTDNRLFNYYYFFDRGVFHDNLMWLSMRYLSYLGTPTMSAEAFSKKMYALGCEYGTNGSNTFSYTNLRGPSENFEPALKLVEDLINNAVPDEKAFQDLIQGELKRRTDSKLNNRSIASALQQYAIYGSDNPQTWYSSNAELLALKSSDLMNIIKQLKSTKHVIDYYGPLELPELQVVVTKNHSLPAAFSPVLPRKEFEMRENTQTEVFFTNYSQVQASIYWFNKSNVLNPAELPMASAFNQYFGGDMSSVVFQNIRESKALAYSTYAWYYPAYEAGKHNYTYAFVGTQADKFHDAVAGMGELLNKIPKDENVFALAKESLMNKLETERVDDEGVSWYYQNLKEQGLSTDPNILEYEMLPRIDIHQVIEFHRNKLANRNYTMAVMADATKIQVKDLEKYGKVTVLSLEEIFGY